MATTNFVDQTTVIEADWLNAVDALVYDVFNGATTVALARTALGLGTADSPQFTGIEVGNASDTTLSRASAGDIAVEGNIVYRAGGTDVPVTDGGTGASTAAGALTNLGAHVAGICEGRLTLTSGTPITVTDVTAATSVYFTPFRGNRVALYTSSVWTLYTFTERTLALGTLTSAKPYDVFLYDNSGTLTLEAVAWTDDTNRATALTTQDGIYVKTGETNKRYLGTFYTTATTTTEDSETKRYLWNYYNRVPRKVLKADSTDSWNYTTNTWRQARASTANQIALVIGVNEDAVEISTAALVSNSTAGVLVYTAIGLDDTTAASADSSVASFNIPVNNYWIHNVATYSGYPGVGQHELVWLERSAASGTTTWYGDNGTFVRSGMFGKVMA